MEIKGLTTSMTPSEASWAAQSLSVRMPDTARKIIAARRLASMSLLPKDIFKGMPELAGDIKGEQATERKLKHLLAGMALEDAERRYAIDEQGNERHTISVNLDVVELLAIKEIAEITQDNSRDIAMNLDATLARWDEEYGSQELIGEELEEPLTANDEELAKEHLFNGCLNDLQIAPGIIAAINSALEGRQ